MGQTGVKIIRNIILAWLAKKSIISTKIKRDKQNKEKSKEFLTLYLKTVEESMLIFGDSRVVLKTLLEN